MVFLNSCWTITHCILGPLNVMDVEVYNLIMFMHLRIHDWLCSLNLGPLCMYNNCSLFLNSWWTITHCTLGPLNVMDVEVYNLIMLMHLRIHDWLCSLNLRPLCMYNNCSLFLNSCWTITHCILGPLNVMDVEVYNLIMFMDLKIHDWLCSLNLGPLCMYKNWYF